MPIPDPFQNLSSHARRRSLLLMFCCSCLLLVIMQWIGEPLKTGAAPQGIVSFELAGTAAAAGDILQSWDPAAKLHAAFSLGLDYLFLIVYAMFISLACRQTAASARGVGHALYHLGLLLAWSQLLAAALDAVENALLLHLLLGASGTFAPAMARWCAAVKFGLVGAGLLYVPTALAILWISRLRCHKKP